MQISLLITWGTIGLILIVLAWIEQLTKSLKKEKKLSKLFIILYLIGVILLVIDGLVNKMYLTSILNLITAILAGIILVIGFNKKKK